MGRERRVVAAAVLGVQAQHDVEHAGLFRCERAVGAQHGKDGLGRGLSGHEAVHDHGFVVEGGLLGVVGQHHDARQAADERERRVNLVLGRAVLGGLVGRVQAQDGTSHHVHEIGRGIHHKRAGRESVGQLALGIDHFHEPVETLLRRQLSHEQQIGHLFESEAARRIQIAQKVVQVVAAQAQGALGRHLLAVGHHIAVNVGDVGHAREHARAVGVAQAALHIVGGIQRRIDGVHLVEVLVQAHAASLVVADLDGLDLVDFGMVVHADDGFIYFHGHGAPSRKMVATRVSDYSNACRAPYRRGYAPPPPRAANGAFSKKLKILVDKALGPWLNSRCCSEVRRYLSWIEGLTTNQYVGGSNPSRRTILDRSEQNRSRLERFFFCQAKERNVLEGSKIETSQYVDFRLLASARSSEGTTAEHQPSPWAPLRLRSHRQRPAHAAPPRCTDAHRTEERTCSIFLK